MPLYRVKWSDDPKDPRASHWWVLGGVITYTSQMLKDWEGGSHAALVRYLHRRGFYVSVLSHKEHVPPTMKYHKELMACTSALIKLLDDRKHEPVDKG